MTDYKLKIPELIHQARDFLDSKGYSFCRNDFSTYYQQIKCASVIGPYTYDTPLMKKLRDKLSPDDRDLFQREMLLKLIVEAFAEINGRNYPVPIKGFFYRDYHRILSAIMSEQPFLLPESDAYQKDLAVLCFRMIPLGPQKVHLKRIGLKPLLRHGLKQSSRAIQMLLDTGGISPFLHLHTCSHDIESIYEFANAKSWHNLYKYAAQLCLLNPQIKGVTGCSWLCDPALRDISPRLYFTLAGQFSFKKELFYTAEAHGQTLRDAIDWDPVRKRLYNQGEYKPVMYLLVIKRSELIAWYHNFGETEDE